MAKKLKKPKAPKKPKRPVLSEEERFAKLQLTFVINALRRRSIMWPPRLRVLRAAYAGQRVSKVSGRLCKHYFCAACGNAFPQSLINLDHIDPVGKKDTSWNWITRMLSPDKNWQVLCKEDHNEKTAAEKAKLA